MASAPTILLASESRWIDQHQIRVSLAPAVTMGIGKRSGVHGSPLSRGRPRFALLTGVVPGRAARREPGTHDHGARYTARAVFTGSPLLRGTTAVQRRPKLIFVNHGGRKNVRIVLMGGLDTSEIKSINLFAELPKERLQALLETAAVERFAPHTLLIKEGDHAGFLHVLLDGAVELFAQVDEEETAITLLRPIAPFILPAVVGDLPYLASARTLRSARILTIRAEAVRALFASDATFARAVVYELSRGFRSLLTELKNQKLRSSIERLAQWLLRANAQLGDKGRVHASFRQADAGIAARHDAGESVAKLEGAGRSGRGHLRPKRHAQGPGEPGRPRACRAHGGRSRIVILPLRACRLVSLARRRCDQDNRARHQPRGIARSVP